MVSVAPLPLAGQGYDGRRAHQTPGRRGTALGCGEAFPPYLAYRPIDWDSALVEAIPKVKLATDPPAFAAAMLPRADGWRYKGRTVMLIDERTQSQAEHTGLFFEAANRTRFIGSPTAGANGDVTTLVLPGGITMSFTGHDVRHADRRQLQRIGLVPDLLVRPTIRGIRAGRDEVLKRAVRWLLQADRAPKR